MFFQRRLFTELYFTDGTVVDLVLDAVEVVGVLVDAALRRPPTHLTPKLIRMVIVPEMMNETRPRFESLSTDLTDEEVFRRFGLVEVSVVVFASVEALDASVALVSASVRRLGTSLPVLRFG
jgi:hypothetical protein